MPTAYLDLGEKLEAAAAAIATGLAIDRLTVLTGSDDEEKKVPNAQLSAISAHEEPAFSGNYRYTLEVRVASRAVEGGLSAHRSLVAQVFDAFHDSELAANLSAAADDFTAIGISERRMSKDNTETQYADTLEIDVYCAPSDL